MRIYTFVIYVMQEIKNINRQDATVSIEKSMDEISSLFEKHNDLDGLVDNIRAIGGDVSEYSNGTDGEYIGGIVKLEIESLYFV